MIYDVNCFLKKEADECIDSLKQIGSQIEEVASLLSQSENNQTIQTMQRHLNLKLGQNVKSPATSNLTKSIKNYRNNTAMQLYHEHGALMDTTKSIADSLNMGTKVNPSNSSEMREKMSSNASLKLMAVASGDNVTLGSVMNSGHKLKETPSLVPCCEGKELQINEDLVRSGLSAISVKHEGLMQCFSVSHACERLQVPPGLMKHRNSFRSLHRPDLKRVPYLRRMAPTELETLFRGYAADRPRNGGKSEKREETSRATPHGTSKTRDMRKTDKGNATQDNDTASANVQEVSLNPIPETRSGAEDVPAGMRLHCARARLYTSVLAGAKAGDQYDDHEASEEPDYKVPPTEEPDIEDEVLLHEELQVILPPRYDEIAPGPSVTTAITAASCSFN